MPTVGNVSDPLGYAMVMMTVGIIPMKETVQVKFQFGLAAKTQKQKFSTTKSPFMQDWVFRPVVQHNNIIYSM